MLRKHMLTQRPGASVQWPGSKDVAALATVLVTSEATEYPIDNVFDGQGGPGGSRWVAVEPGVQQIMVAFDRPQTVHTLGLEIEELGGQPGARTAVQKKTPPCEVQVPKRLDIALLTSRLANVLTLELYLFVRA